MKKTKFLFFASSLIALSSLIVVNAISSKEEWTDVKAFAEIEGYNLVLDNNLNSEFKYHYLEQKYNVKNYQDEDITLKYKRCRNENGYYMVMSPGGSLYNPYLSDSSNFNSLCGMNYIKVNFTSSTGKLFISYGLDEDYLVNEDRLVSGKPYYFTSLKPSHFKLSTLNDVNATNDVYISSIEIHYYSDDYYDTRQANFTNVYVNQNSDTILSGANKTYQLGNVSISNNNYISIKYKSNQQLKGTLNYYDLTNHKNVAETIFLEPSIYEIEFNTFLDNFRKGSTGLTNKRLDSLSLTNVGSAAANVNIYSVGYSDRTYSRNDVLYISDETIELGVSLRFGGAISSIRNLNKNIQEYVDNNNVIKIRGSDKHNNDYKYVIKDNPNLVNIHDVGREIQQSWYMNVNTEQGYSPSNYLDKPASYNPVQGGSQKNNESQLVDYSIVYSDESNQKVSAIYIKTKALDWAKDNDLSNSYMENFYSIENGLIRVKNRFIDFSGWTNYEDNVGFPQGDLNTNGHEFLSVLDAPLYNAQELPAVYTVHPLDYFGSVMSDPYNGETLIFDNTLGWNVGTDPISNMSGITSSSSYEGEATYKLSTPGGHYEFRRHNENWLGFFNEDKFGLAVYMPANAYNSDGDRHVFVAGMLKDSHSTSLVDNRSYLDANLNTVKASFYSASSAKESCYTDNTGYLSTVLGFYVPNYVAIEYTYLIGADYLNTLRSKFKTIRENEEVYNDFTAWKGALI